MKVKINGFKYKYARHHGCDILNLRDLMTNNLTAGDCSGKKISFSNF
ncbi:hypothetical protein SOV_07880 [Sporomusa ovata DSM 2662]|nr:hypothetical protein SOV_1c01260 [Sporomusa ovata DSM 2662]